MTLDEALKLPDGIYEGIPEDVYHQLDYFSSSYAKDLLQNPALAQEEKKVKKYMDIGLAVHALTLEDRDTLNRRFAFVPEKAPNKPTSKQIEAKKPSEDTLAAISWWSLFEKANAGKIILTAADKVTVENTVKAIRIYPCVVKRKLFQAKRNEITVIYTDHETGIRCKSRFDSLSDDGVYLDDLKSTSDASSFAFNRTIQKLRYYVQGGAYSIAAHTAGLNIKTVRLCAASTNPPHQVLVGEFTRQYLEIGQSEFMRALNIEKECRELKMYPNIQLPQSLPSLYEVFNPDGTVKKDDDLYEIFECPSWL